MSNQELTSAWIRIVTVRTETGRHMQQLIIIIIIHLSSVYCAPCAALKISNAFNSHNNATRGVLFFSFTDAETEAQKC